jgi:hypothetical protein
VQDLPNKTGCQKLRDFFLDGFLLVGGKASHTLLDGFRTLIDVNSVLSQLSRDT